METERDRERERELPSRPLRSFNKNIKQTVFLSISAYPGDDIKQLRGTLINNHGPKADDKARKQTNTEEAACVLNLSRVVFLRARGLLFFHSQLLLRGGKKILSSRWSCERERFGVWGRSVHTQSSGMQSGTRRTCLGNIARSVDWFCLIFLRNRINTQGS